MRIQLSVTRSPQTKLNVSLSGPAQPFDEWLQGDVIRAYTFFRQGQERHKQKSYSEAIKELDNAIKLYPDFTAAYNARGKSKLFLAELKMDRGETGDVRKYFSEAISDYNKVNEFIPDDIQVFHNRGLAKFKLGELAVTPEEKQAQYNAAISDFDELIIFNPDDTDVCLQRALAQFLLGILASTPGEEKERYNAAISDYSKAIEQEATDNGQAYVIRGIAKYFLGELAGNTKTTWSVCDEVAKDLTKAFEINPDSVNDFELELGGNAGDYYIQGVVEFLRGQSKANYGHTEKSRKHYNTAISNFSKAIEHGANNAKVYLYRSKVYSRIGQQKKAEADFRKAKQLDPNTEG